MAPLWAQIVSVILGVSVAVIVILMAPDGPPMPHRPRRKRPCGHRHGAWVCVADQPHGSGQHYYRRAES